MKTASRGVVGTLVGAAAGYAWYATVGCMNGACPISSNPLFSTFYGAAIGFLAGTIPTGKGNG